MNRLLSPALVALAALTVGCGGSIGNLLATVPPPVEFSGGGAGVVELPKSGVFRGDLKVERVTMTQDSTGAWTQTGATVLSEKERAVAEVRESAITLGRDGETAPLFSGTLTVVTASPGATYADLTAFDGHKERYTYTLLRGDTTSLRIAARAAIDRDGKTYRFDRYTFELAP